MCHLVADIYLCHPLLECCYFYDSLQLAVYWATKYNVYLTINGIFCVQCIKRTFNVLAFFDKEQLFTPGDYTWFHSDKHTWMHLHSPGSYPVNPGFTATVCQWNHDKLLRRSSFLMHVWSSKPFTALEGSVLLQVVDVLHWYCRELLVVGGVSAKEQVDALFSGVSTCDL